MSALLPCPFCGGVADLRESNIPRSFGCRVGCDACGIYTTNIGSDLNIPEVKASTVAAWNTRAAASAPQPVSDLPEFTADDIKQAFVSGAVEIIRWAKLGVPTDDLDEAAYDYIANIRSKRPTLDKLDQTVAES